MIVICRAFSSFCVTDWYTKWFYNLSNAANAWTYKNKSQLWLLDSLVRVYWTRKHCIATSLPQWEEKDPAETRQRLNQQRKGYQFIRANILQKCPRGTVIEWWVHVSLGTKLAWYDLVLVQLNWHSSVSMVQYLTHGYSSNPPFFLITVDFQLSTNVSHIRARPSHHSFPLSVLQKITQQLVLLEGR